MRYNAVGVYNKEAQAVDMSLISFHMYPVESVVVFESFVDGLERLGVELIVAQVKVEQLSILG